MVELTDAHPLGVVVIKQQKSRCLEPPGWTEFRVNLALWPLLECKSLALSSSPGTGRGLGRVSRSRGREPAPGQQEGPKPAVSQPAYVETRVYPSILGPLPP